MKTKVVGSTLLFCLIFGLAFYLRQFTFWLPRWQGDQSQYIMLAMKLGDRLNFADYNLREINVEKIEVDDPTGTEIVYPYRVRGQKGSVIETYETRGLHYYDVPFFYKAPLLPIVLNLSHRLFAERDQPYSIVFSDLGRSVLHHRPPLLFKTQFWAAIVPMICGFLTLIILYFWSRRNMGEEAALIAAFVFATNPVGIQVSSRVWTEELAMLFFISAMFVYRRGFRIRRAWICLASGVLMGLAVLANQKTLMAAGILGIYSWWMLAARQKTSGRWFGIFTDRMWWSFCGGITAMTAGWFWTIYRHFGNPLWVPEVITRMLQGREIASLGGKANMQQWYDILLSQPHGLIYYPVGTVAICWAFGAGYLTLREGFQSARNAFLGRAFDERFLFLWCWVLIYTAYFLPHRTGEYRYIYFVYPALAALSGWMLVKIGDFFATFTAHRFIAKGTILIFLAFSASHSVRLVMTSLWLQMNLIAAPWATPSVPTPFN